MRNAVWWITSVVINYLIDVTRFIGDYIDYELCAISRHHASLS